MKVGDLVRGKTFDGTGIIIKSHWHKYGHFWLHTVQTCCAPNDPYFTRQVSEAFLELVNEAG